MRRGRFVTDDHDGRQGRQEPIGYPERDLGGKEIGSYQGFRADHRHVIDGHDGNAEYDPPGSTSAGNPLAERDGNQGEEERDQRECEAPLPFDGVLGRIVFVQGMDIFQLFPLGQLNHIRKFFEAHLTWAIGCEGASQQVGDVVGEVKVLKSQTSEFIPALASLLQLDVSISEFEMEELCGVVERDDPGFREDANEHLGVRVVHNHDAFELAFPVVVIDIDDFMTQVPESAGFQPAPSDGRLFEHGDQLTARIELGEEHEVPAQETDDQTECDGGDQQGGGSHPVCAHSQDFAVGGHSTQADQAAEEKGNGNCVRGEHHDETAHHHEKVGRSQPDGSQCVHTPDQILAQEGQDHGGEGKNRIGACLNDDLAHQNSRKPHAEVEYPSRSICASNPSRGSPFHLACMLEPTLFLPAGFL